MNAYMSREAAEWFRKEAEENAAAQREARAFLVEVAAEEIRQRGATPERLDELTKAYFAP